MDAHVDGAMALYAGGDSAGAQALCRTVLSVDKRNLRALYLYGTILLQQSQAAEAIELFTLAVEIAPNFAGTRTNLGVALRASGRLEEAVESYRASIDLDPTNPDVRMNLGNSLNDLGRYKEAETEYYRCLELRPNYALAYDNLGIALREQGKIDEAIDAFRRAIDIAPKLASAHNNLGISLLSQDRIDESRDAFVTAINLDRSDWRAWNNLADAERRAEHYEDGVRLADESTRINPRFAEGYFTAGLCYNELNEHALAIQRYRSALALRSEYAEARYNLARCLRHVQKYDEAIVEFNRTIAIKSNLVEAHNALGALYQEIVDVDKALACYSAAIALEPTHVTAHWNRALMRLTIGEYDLGFTDFEWRYKLAHAPVEYPGIPGWDGEDLKGVRLFVRSEQGFGDTIQFVRFLSELTAAGAHVTLECQPGLGDLLKGSGLCHAVREADPDCPASPAEFDKQVWLMSLPGILGVRFETIPATMPYLQIPDHARLAWHEKIEAIRRSTGSKIVAGVVWAGSRKNANDHLRSLTLANLQPLAELDSVTLVSLQQGPPVTQLPNWQGKKPIYVPTPTMRDFIDTAAMILSLDVVITVDTVVAHIAGALGRPVWTMIPYGPDWRWSIDRSDTPWYPSMRLFRQPKPGDWAGVVDDVKAALQELLPN